MTDLKKLAEAATAQNFDTAQHIESGEYECPLCGGEGEVDGTTYTNYDNVAVGVQFFGIGKEYKTTEAYYRAANPKAILELLQEVETLRATIKQMRLDARDDNSADIAAEARWKERQGEDYGSY